MRIRRPELAAAFRQALAGEEVNAQGPEAEQQRNRTDFALPIVTPAIDYYGSKRIYEQKNEASSASGAGIVTAAFPPVTPLAKGLMVLVLKVSYYQTDIAGQICHLMLQGPGTNPFYLDGPILLPTFSLATAGSVRVYDKPFIMTGRRTAGDPPGDGLGGQQLFCQRAAGAGGAIHMDVIYVSLTPGEYTWLP